MRIRNGVVGAFIALLLAVGGVVGVSGPAYAADVGSIVGTVTGPNGGLLDAEITPMYKVGSEWQTDGVVHYPWNSDGDYLMEGLEPRQYILLVAAREHPTLATAYYVQGSSTGTSDPDRATVLTVTAGGKLTGVNIRLGVGATLSGKVTDPAGHPLQAQVGVRGELSNVQTETDPVTGIYQAVGLAAGDYTVGFSADGYVDKWWGGGEDPTPIHVDAGAAVLGIDVVLAARGGLSGQVRVPTGFSTKSVYITLYQDVSWSKEPNSWGYAGSAWGGATGKYSFTGLNPVRHKVCFELLGVQFRCYVNSSKITNATPVAVKPGATTTGVNVTFSRLTPTMTVTGKGAKKKATVKVAIKPTGGTAHGKSVKATGKVRIKLGSKVLKTSTLSGGKVTVTVTKLKKGKRKLAITYLGDKVFKPATKVVAVKVKK